MKLIAVLIVVLTGFFIQGCATKVSTADRYTPLTVKQGNSLRDAIFAAANRRRWIAADNGPGVVRCTLMPRGHRVVVDVYYNDKGITIRYVESENMSYDPSDKEISRKYEQWVKNLQVEIFRFSQK